jgi:hypothetical protein
MKPARLLFFLALLSFTGLTASCVSTTNHFATQSWLGHSQSDLAAAWGPPEAEFSDGRGGKILTYERISAYKDPGSAIPEDSGGCIVQKIETNLMTHHQVFYVDSSGKIYLWRRQ